MPSIRPTGPCRATGSKLGRVGTNEKLLEIALHAISDLKPFEKSPRQHSARQIKQVAASIREFGFLVPVLVDGDATIVAGHARVLAAERLGWTEVPTIMIDHLSNAQLRAFRIADNRLSEVASWNDVILAEALSELSLLDLDFDLDITGFELAEIDVRIQSLTPIVDPKADPADIFPDAVKSAPVTRLGDLWQLGHHRVLCGNALDVASYGTLMGGHVAAAVFTDPPYNVPIAGHVSGLGAVKHQDFAMACGEMSPAEFTSFLAGALGHAVRHSCDGSLHYVCMDWRHLRELMAAGTQTYSELKNLCVWAKDNGGMGSLYRSRHELVLVYKSGTKPHRNNVELGRHGRNRSNVWSYLGVNSFGRRTEEGNLLELHPTVKPVALVADAILDCTLRKDIVLDPFLGSGTTLIAAERVGRRCYGVELDPVYVDTIVRRWQAITGEAARRARDGQIFDKCAHDARKAREVNPGTVAVQLVSENEEIGNGN